MTCPYALASGLVGAVGVLAPDAVFSLAVFTFGIAPITYLAFAVALPLIVLRRRRASDCSERLKFIRVAGLSVVLNLLMAAGVSILCAGPLTEAARRAIGT